MKVPVHSITGASASEIAGSIEEEILAGRFAPGAGLPTVRALARALSLSPGTVASAYKSLKGRGLLVAQGRRGTQVSPRPPVHRGTLLPRFGPGVRDLASGNPDPALLPPLSDALARIDASPVLYGDDLIDAELSRRGLAALRADGIPAGELCVCSGALDGLERVLAARLRPGDRVAVEDPAFVGVRDLLAVQGLVAVPVAIDDSGLRPESLARVLGDGVAALVLTPRAQNPTGACLDARRVRALAPILARHPEVLLCEDDHAGSVAGAPATTLVTRGRERWAVVRSFSKSLGPDLRVALLAADATTIGRVQGRQRLGMRWVSHLMQRLVVRLSKDRSVEALLRRASRTYAKRRRAVIDALARHGIEAHGRSGLNVWVPVPEEVPVVAALLESGWGVSAGERFRLASPPAIRVSAANLPAEEAPEFASVLARVLSPQRARTIA